MKVKSKLRIDQPQKKETPIQLTSIEFGDKMSDGVWNIPTEKGLSGHQIPICGVTFEKENGVGELILHAPIINQETKEVSEIHIPVSRIRFESPIIKPTIIPTPQKLN